MLARVYSLLRLRAAGPAPSQPLPADSAVSRGTNRAAASGCRARRSRRNAALPAEGGGGDQCRSRSSHGVVQLLARPFHPLQLAESSSAGDATRRRQRSLVLPGRRCQCALLPPGEARQEHPNTQTGFPQDHGQLNAYVNLEYVVLLPLQRGRFS